MINQVAFLGLGAMGVPMAANLARAGFSVRGWNRSERPFPELGAAGVEVCTDLAEAVREAQVVCLCVLDGAAAEAVMDQALPHLRPATIVIDHSTLGVATARNLAKQAFGRGVSYLDAPVSGGAAGAAAADLTLMVGGERSAFLRVGDVLAAQGERIHYMGRPGTGQATKLVNQLLTAVHSAAAVEGLHLGRRLGLDLDALHAVLATSFGASRMLERSVPVVRDEAFESSFTVDVLAKDLALIEALGRETATPLPLADTALGLYRDGQAAGLGGLDAAALIRLLSDRADQDAD